MAAQADSDKAYSKLDRRAIERMRKSIEREIKRIDLEDLEVVDDAALADTDDVQTSRLVYAAGLVRLLGILRKKAPDWDTAMKQGQLALAYVKHAESAGMRQQQIGRTTGDDQLISDVAKLRKELKQTAEAKASADRGDIADA